jgi:hypothetical protein
MYRVWSEYNAVRFCKIWYLLFLLQETFSPSFVLSCRWKETDCSPDTVNVVRIRIYPWDVPQEHDGHTAAYKLVYVRHSIYHTYKWCLNNKHPTVNETTRICFTATVFILCRATQICCFLLTSVPVAELQNKLFRTRNAETSKITTVLRNTKLTLNVVPVT